MIQKMISTETSNEDMIQHFRDMYAELEKKRKIFEVQVDGKTVFKNL